MKKIRQVGKNKWLKLVRDTKRETFEAIRKKRPQKSPLSSRRSKWRKPFHEEFIRRTPENRVAEIISVEGFVVTFKTENGITYKLDFDKTAKTDKRFRQKIEDSEFFYSIKVKNGNFAFMDKNEPAIVVYPNGEEREEIGYFSYYTIEDRMFLLEKISE